MVTFITGPMYAFKSSALFSKIERHMFAKDQVLLIRPKWDNRGYFSHSAAVNASVNGMDIPTAYVSSYDDFNGLYRAKLETSNAVFMDEAFMVKDAWKLAAEFGADKDVYFAGLLASSENKVFDEVSKLLPYCDEIVKLNGVCMDCGSQLGNYSYFIGAKKTEDILVGDKEFLCLCARCRKARENGALGEE